MSKTTQLQLRISPADKARLQRRARMAGMELSPWILRTLLPPVESHFQDICRRLHKGSVPRSIVLAELHDLLQACTAQELRDLAARGPEVELPPFEANYVAAMIEQAAVGLDVAVPDWVRRVTPLAEPYFASDLQALRLHLLCSSPPAFRRRNLFIDSTLGERV